MINDKEKLWYGAILVATVVLSIYMFVIVDKHIPVIDQSLIDSQESIGSLQEQFTKQNAMLELLQADLKLINKYTTEKEKDEKQVLAIKSVCHGYLSINEADALRKAGKLNVAADTLKETKELFWKAGDVLTIEQSALRGLMNPIDAIMSQWTKGEKTADTSKLSIQLTTILKKVDQFAEHCTVIRTSDPPVVEKHLSELPDEKRKVAIKALCSGWQRLTEAEAKHKQGNLSAAGETLSLAKDIFLQANETLPSEQKTLRDLTGSIDGLLSQWKGGNKIAESSAIATAAKGIMQKTGIQPEACSVPLPELSEEQRKIAIKALCTGWQRLAEAESKHKKDNLSAASETLNTVKEPIWEASEVLAAEQKNLRDLLSPISALVSKWKEGNKAAESSLITAVVKGVMQKINTQPEACPAPPAIEVAAMPPPAKPVVEVKPQLQPAIQAPMAMQAPMAYAPAPTNYQPAPYVPANYAPAAPAAPSPPVRQEAICTIAPSKDSSRKVAITILRSSLVNISVAETLHQLGNLKTAADILKSTRLTLWEAGDMLISEQNALSSVMLPLDNIVTQWEKGDKNAETSMIYAKVEAILNKLDRIS
ncbi:MAG: hypothetical protein HOP02_10390 [Methylococcaceae bacterium]|nr:hypothetical protein [Methylococcaceae bacterium]